jgi:dienelactone hydrolase
MKKFGIGFIWAKVSRTLIHAVAKRGGDKLKRFGTCLIAVMLGLALACGSQEAKAPAKPVAAPEKAEKATHPAPPAQAARMEIHSFQSMTLTDQEFLTGRKGGKPVTLAGELRLPRPGNDRLPVVVLQHGSGGVSGNILDWEQDLNAMGVATFVLDSFTARGIVNTLSDQSQLGMLTMIVDDYRALDVLARHPRIDPTRIALMGFSSGARATLYASLKRFQRLHGPEGQQFAAYIAFHTPCYTTFRDDEDVADKPIRLFHGSADEWTPVAPCRAYVERLKAKGKDVQLTEYAGAQHGFDYRAYKTPLKLEKAQNSRRCECAEAENGVIVNVKTKQPFTWADPCVEYGATIAYDEKAATEARRAVKDFLTTTFKP